MEVKIENLTLAYGDFTAVDDLSLSIDDGESVVLLGQSGCGKTSTMRCVAGLEQPSNGRITIGDRTVFDAATKKDVPAYKRNVGLVFQSYAVWPHKTVLENVAFPQLMKKAPGAEAKRRALESLELVGLSHLADRGASMLSGGQMQRVALARSLAMQPNVMLLDEPLSNLDARLRDDLRIELRRLQNELGITSIYVTHDQSEALALADKVAIMQNGRIAQLASPEEMYQRPASASIARFMGVSNVFPVDASQSTGQIAVEESGKTILTAGLPTARDALRACIRPENISLSPEGSNALAANVWAGTVTVAVFQGSYIRYGVHTDTGLTFDTMTFDPRRDRCNVGDRVQAEVLPEHVDVMQEDVGVLNHGG